MVRGIETLGNVSSGPRSIIRGGMMSSSKI